MRSGRRLAVDVGKVRVGLAASDFHAILASGLATLARAETAEATAEAILASAAEVEPIEIYVGLPVGLSGKHTAATEDALAIARALVAKSAVPVRLIDERMSTVIASEALKSSGRDSKSGRKIIDQIAATVILEQALEMEKRGEQTPGLSLEDIDG